MKPSRHERVSSAVTTLTKGTQIDRERERERETDRQRERERESE